MGSASSQNEPDRSIFSAILVPMVLLVIAELLLFAGILMASGTFDRLNQNAREILDQQVESRKDNLENYLAGTVGNMQSLANSVNASASRMLEAGEFDLDSLQGSAMAADAILLEVSDDALSTLRSKRASGVFIVFSLGDLPTQGAGGPSLRNGLYIRDMDPAATPSPRNEDLAIVRGSTALVQTLRITTDGQWSPNFDLAAGDPRDFDFITQPYQAARSREGAKEARDFAYWGVAPLLGAGTEQHVVTYSMPLVLDDGTVYGVVGVDLSADYLKTLLPAGELFNDEDASYILGVQDNGDHAGSTTHDVELHPVVVNGRTVVEGSSYGQVMKLDPGYPGAYSYTVNGVRYYVDCEQFRLYNTNAPFESHQWVLAGMVEESVLHQFSNQVVTLLVAAGLLMLLLGVLGSMLVGRSLSRPVAKLADEVSNAQLKRAEMPELARTGVREIDSLTGAINTLSADIASVKQLEQQRIEHERDYDLLTGLMNRRAFYREASRVLNSSEAKNAAIVMFDLDNLKHLNDTYGHDWGDKYIYQAGRCFEEGLDSSGLVARMSGDEFMVLLYGFDDPADAEASIEKLHQAVSGAHIPLPDGKEHRTSASGGVAMYPQDGRDLIELMKLADFAMYQAKLAGKDRIAFFDIATYQEQDTVRRAMDELNALFADTKLAEYHFQPIYSLRSGAVFAYEALMRVTMNSLRCPEDVITLARQESRLAEVENMTWARTFESYRALLNRDVINAQAYLFVNSFANIAIDASELAQLAEEYPQVVSRLVVEITEAENMSEDAMDVKRSIPGFSGLFALDDYGSGYNSEIMLLDLKPAFVKVDITIVRDIDTSIDKQRIVSNLVAYAHERGMMIVAEGVETAAELEMVISLDVDLAQGFFLARPARTPGQINEEALELILAASEGEE